MIKVITRIFKDFKKDNVVEANQETMIARAIRAGWEAAQKDNERHRRVRRSYRGIVSRSADEQELPY